MDDNDLEARRQEVTNTFNAAADHFDAPGNIFWDLFGGRTVDRIGLEPGWRVLDLACGTGASAVPAAKKVGPEGKVTGIDLASNMLANARARARGEGVENIHFEVGDMRSPPFEPGSLDAVISVFGVFFVPAMEEVVSTWWDLLRPGGRLAITSWGEVIFTPFMEKFVEVIIEPFPEMMNEERPWERIKTPGMFRKMLEDAGVQNLEIEFEQASIPTGPEMMWDLVIGSGMRGAIDALPDQKVMEIRTTLETWAVEEDVTQMETSVLYARATK